MSLSEQQKNDILNLFQGAGVEKLFLFEQAPDDKLNNARESYASLMKDDEVFVLLYDDTVFGSANEGFLLTSSRLFQKNIAEQGAFINIANITDITVKHRLLTSNVLVHSEMGALNMTLTESSSRKNDIVVHLLQRTIEILKNTNSGAMPTNTNVTQKLQCRGCGAGRQNAMDACEYCGTRF